jgi:hypothetical protein
VNTQSNQSIRVSSLPPPIAVVIPAPSHHVTTSPKRPVIRQSSYDGLAADRLPFHDGPDHVTLILEDDNDSDDEDDADYIDDETREVDEQLRPSKRCRSNPGEDLSSSRRSTRQSSESSQSEPARQMSNVESEPIPVQGVLRLRHDGPR